MAEKKKEFFERFTESHDGGIEAGEYYLWKSNDSAGKVWQWVEKLVEEVEKKTEEDLVGEYGTFGMRPED